MSFAKEILYEDLLANLCDQQGSSMNTAVPDRITVDGCSCVNQKKATWTMIKDAARQYKPDASKSKTVEQYLVQYISKLNRDLPPRKAKQKAASSSNAPSTAPTIDPTSPDMISLPAKDVQAFMVQQVSLMRAIETRMTQESKAAAVASAPPQQQQPLSLQNGGSGDALTTFSRKIDKTVDRAAELLIRDEYDEVLKEAATKMLRDMRHESRVFEAAVKLCIEEDRDQVLEVAAKRCIEEDRDEVLEVAAKRIKLEKTEEESEEDEEESDEAEEESDEESES